MRNVIFGVTISAALLLFVGCSQSPSGDASILPSPKALVATATPQASTVLLAAASPVSQASPVGTSQKSPVTGSSTAPTAESQAVKTMQEETGLSFTIPSGAVVDVKRAGEIWFKCEPDLFVALETVDDMDTAMKSGVARMKAIDKHAKVLTTKARDQGGAATRGTRGTMMVDGKEAQWVVLGFDAGKKVLRIVIIGKDIRNDASAIAFGNSIQKQAPQVPGTP